MQHSTSRLVLDFLKLQDPPLHQFAIQLGSIPNVDDVKVSVVEIDQITESVKVTVEGRNIDLDSVQTIMKDHGATIHSIDEVVVKKSAPTLVIDSIDRLPLDILRLITN